MSGRQRRKLVSPYWSNWSWPVLLVVAVLLPHIIYWTNMRMRAPLMTVVPIFAVIGLRVLCARKDDEPISVGGPPTPLSDPVPEKESAAAQKAAR